MATSKELAQERLERALADVRGALAQVGSARQYLAPVEGAGNEYEALGRLQGAIEKEIFWLIGLRGSTRLDLDSETKERLAQKEVAHGA